MEVSAVPFECDLWIEGGKGLEVVRSSWDEGALESIMCMRLYEKLKDGLGKLRQSVRMFRLANGTLVKGAGRWSGWCSIGKVRVFAAFEVFDSGGSWEFLLGKPMKKAFNVVHEYGEERVTVGDKWGRIEVENQHGKRCDGETRNIPICVVEDVAENFNVGAPVDIFAVSADIFTRRTDPFAEERVAEVLRLVQIGDDLSVEERTEVRALVAEFADCFALSVSEVFPVEGAVHKLNIPQGSKFSTKVRQRPLTPPQKKYLHGKIEEMLEAGIIEPCGPEDVRCVSPTTLAQKAHGGEGLSMVELQHKVNDECVKAGLEPRFDLPEREVRAEAETEEVEKEQKWRICQNFGEVNRVTEIAAMPQGDIRTKQQRLSGHRWVSLFDFASGFYAYHPRR